MNHAVIAFIQADTIPSSKPYDTLYPQHTIQASAQPKIHASVIREDAQETLVLASCDLLNYSALLDSFDLFFESLMPLRSSVIDSPTLRASSGSFLPPNSNKTTNKIMISSGVPICGIAVPSLFSTLR